METTSMDIYMDENDPPSDSPILPLSPELPAATRLDSPGTISCSDSYRYGNQESSDTAPKCPVIASELANTENAAPTASENIAGQPAGRIVADRDQLVSKAPPEILVPAAAGPSKASGAFESARLSQGTNLGGENQLNSGYDNVKSSVGVTSDEIETWFRVEKLRDCYATCTNRDKHLLDLTIKNNPFQEHSGDARAKRWQEIATAVDNETKNTAGSMLLETGTNAQRRFVVLMRAYHDYLSGSNDPLYTSIRNDYHKTKSLTRQAYCLYIESEDQPFSSSDDSSKQKHRTQDKAINLAPLENCIQELKEQLSYLNMQQDNRFSELLWQQQQQQERFSAELRSDNANVRQLLMKTEERYGYGLQRMDDLIHHVSDASGRELQAYRHIERILKHQNAHSEVKLAAIEKRLIDLQNREGNEFTSGSKLLLPVLKAVTEDHQLKNEEWKRTYYEWKLMKEQIQDDWSNMKKEIWHMQREIIAMQERNARTMMEFQQNLFRNLRGD